MQRKGYKPGASQTEELYNSRTDATLSEAAKIYRDAFCREYIKDFNAIAALARIGCRIKSLRTRAGQLLREPYVANKIDELVRRLRPEDVVTRQQVMARMWLEANDDGNSSIARVAATAHVGKMLGMFKTDDSEDTKTVQTGVMMIPVVSVDDWASSAATAQALLKSQARGEYPPPPPPMMPQPAALNGNN